MHVHPNTGQHYGQTGMYITDWFVQRGMQSQNNTKRRESLCHTPVNAARIV